MAAVFSGIAAGHVKKNRSIWIRYCSLNVLEFFFFSFCVVVKIWRWRFWRNNGYRITTEIHSFKWCIQTGKSWVFKFACSFSHPTYGKPGEDAIANYVIWLKSKTCVFMACIPSLAFRARCSQHGLAQKSFQLVRKRRGLITVTLFLCNLNSLKKSSLPVGKVNRIH